MPNLLKP